MSDAPRDALLEAATRVAETTASALEVLAKCAEATRALGSGESSDPQTRGLAGAIVLEASRLVVAKDRRQLAEFLSELATTIAAAPKRQRTPKKAKEPSP